MRLSLFLAVIGVAGLSVLATAYTLRSGNNDRGFALSAHEKAMLQEIDRLHKTIESMTADLNRLNLNPDRLPGVAPAVNAATPKHGMTPTAAAPATPNTGTPGGSPPATGQSPRSLVVMVNPTPEQNAYFEGLKQRFDDPSFVRTLNLSELTQMEEMKALPALLQKVILGKAIEKFNRGEVDKNTFLADKSAQPAR
jgi:hypothetical protein